jgi:hypothetical protein
MKNSEIFCLKKKNIASEFFLLTNLKIPIIIIPLKLFNGVPSVFHSQSEGSQLWLPVE